MYSGNTAFRFNRKKTPRCLCRVRSFRSCCGKVLNRASELGTPSGVLSWGLLSQSGRTPTLLPSFALGFPINGNGQLSDLKAGMITSDEVQRNVVSYTSVATSYFCLEIVRYTTFLSLPSDLFYNFFLHLGTLLRHVPGRQKDYIYQQGNEECSPKNSCATSDWLQEHTPELLGVIER